MEIVAVVSDSAGESARPFAGRALVQHTLFAVRAARPVTRTVLVTANAGLSQLAIESDAEVVAPPPAASPATPAAILAHVLAELRTTGGPVPAIAILLDPHYPLRSTDVIEGAIDHLLRCGADTLFSVTALDAPLWMEDERGVVQRLSPVPPQRRLAENGAVIAVRIGIFAQCAEIPAGRTVLYQVPSLAAIRVDNGAAWPLVESMQRAQAAAQAQTRLRGIGLLAFDFDGVMTDNRVVVFEDGREAVVCNRSDGLGLERLKATGLPLVVISKEKNPVVAARCRKLKIACEQGVDDKLTILQRIAGEHGVALPNVAFVGNDINDLPCLTAVGVAVAPADAYPEVLRVAHVITRAAGGVGAVREICDLILASQAAS